MSEKADAKITRVEPGLIRRVPAGPDEPPRKGPKIPPREPKGESDWRVTVRHSPLKVKCLTVRAGSREEAWQKFLAQAAVSLTPEAYKADGPARLRAAQDFLAAARKGEPAALAGVEILGAEYAKKRLEALRVKGTVTREQIGFPELASA